MNGWVAQPGPASNVGVVVLAAGRGVRFGGDVPKPLVMLAGTTLLARALAAAVAAAIGPVVVVVSDDRVGEAVPSGIEVLRNATPEAGIASSLQVALRALEPRDEVDAVVIGLAD